MSRLTRDLDAIWPTRRIALAGTAPSVCGSIQETHPLFLADWLEVLFIHYAVDPGLLQRDTPFAVDLRDGLAWVSLVAFRSRNFRLAWGAVRPLADETDRRS